ncbi:hypothetical protein KCU62_g356, partial [Aureobasidium sp. EXF-3399]
MVRYSKSLKDPVSGLHTSIRAPGSKPFHVVIDWQHIYCGIGKIIKLSSKPDSLRRQHAVPPEPLSCGIVRAMRLSSAPATSAPFPFLEQPVTAIFFVLMLASGKVSRTSRMRLIPQAHATMAPLAPSSGADIIVVVYDDGYSRRRRDGVKDTVLPCTQTVTVRFGPEIEPNTLSGFPGFAPNSKVWKSSLTSRWRHAKSERVLTGLPLANMKGTAGIRQISADRLSLICLGFSRTINYLQAQQPTTRTPICQHVTHHDLARKPEEGTIGDGEKDRCRYACTIVATRSSSRQKNCRWGVQDDGRCSVGQSRCGICIQGVSDFSPSCAAFEDLSKKRSTSPPVRFELTSLPFRRASRSSKAGAYSAPTVLALLCLFLQDISLTLIITIFARNTLLPSSNPLKVAASVVILSLLKLPNTAPLAKTVKAVLCEYPANETISLAVGGCVVPGGAVCGADDKGKPVVFLSKSPIWKMRLLVGTDQVSVDSVYAIFTSTDIGEAEFARDIGSPRNTAAPAATLPSESLRDPDTEPRECCQKRLVIIKSATYKIPQPRTPDLANGLGSCDLSLEVRSVLHNIQLYSIAGATFSMDLFQIDLNDGRGSSFRARLTKYCTAYSVFSLIIELRAIYRSLSDVPDVVTQYPCIVACLLQEWTFGCCECQDCSYSTALRKFG